MDIIISNEIDPMDTERQIEIGIISDSDLLQCHNHNFISESNMNLQITERS